MDCNIRKQDAQAGNTKTPETSERFVAFRFSRKLKPNIKQCIKIFGCTWNTLHNAWLCHSDRAKELEEILDEEKISHSKKNILMPKGMISSNPKVENLETSIELLEKQTVKESERLLKEVYQYDSNLRPENFENPPDKESKSNLQINIETDFHQKSLALQDKRKKIGRLRQKLEDLEKSADKTFSMGAPLEIADALVQEYFYQDNKKTLQFCSDTFWAWDGIKYAEEPFNGMRKICYEFLRDAKVYTDDGKFKPFNPNKTKIDQILDAIKSNCYQNCHPTSGAVWLDRHAGLNPKYLISFQNGILDLQKWLTDPETPLLQHTPLFLNVNSLPFDFDSKATHPKQWLKFLNDIWTDDLQMQETLQEWMGYCVTQDTQFQKSLLIIGPTRSGKGTISRILRRLLGESNVVGPTLSSFANEFGLQPLLNKTLAIISDARVGGNTHVIIERLLSISGEDALTINRKYLTPITVTLPTRIMMVSNEIPDLKDASGALAGRFVILPMTKSWFGKEDSQLFSRLCTELPGILLWALKGLARLLARGEFMHPASSNQVAEEIEAITTPVRVFVREKCQFTPLERVSIRELFQAWCEWCDATQYGKKGTPQSFGKSLRTAFPQIQTSRPQIGDDRDRYYLGIHILG